MKKTTILNLEQVKEIEKTCPTPFHIYDEKAIRKNARALKEAFSWNKNYREYFAVKATPNPFILKILQEEGCGVDCSSFTELILSEAWILWIGYYVFIQCHSHGGIPKSKRTGRIYQSG